MKVKMQNKKGFIWKAIDHHAWEYTHVIEFDHLETAKLLHYGVHLRSDGTDEMAIWLKDATRISMWSRDGAMPATVKLEFGIDGEIDEFMVEFKLRWL